MAEVLLAELDGTRVAVKRVLPPLRKNAKVLALFKEEARLFSLLRHPNIPALVASRADHLRSGGTEAGDEPWLALEYVEGVDLAALLRTHKKLPVEVVVTIASAMAHALAHAHALRDEKGEPMRVVHRDVSPSNVLLSVAGDVKLADFGVARHDARPKMTKTGALVGKLMYMAPEQMRGAKVDARTDVFGWGVVAYEMLAGQRPFERDDVDSLSFTTLVSLSSRRRGVDKTLASAIERALELEPERRHADGAAIVKALKAVPFAIDANSVGALVRALAPVNSDGADETLVDGTLTDPNPTLPTVPVPHKAKRRRS